MDGDDGDIMYLSRLPFLAALAPLLSCLRDSRGFRVWILDAELPALPCIGYPKSDLVLRRFRV